MCAKMQTEKNKKIKIFFQGIFLAKSVQIQQFNIKMRVEMATQEVDFRHPDGLPDRPSRSR
jgi:hypothetical protein